MENQSAMTIESIRVGRPASEGYLPVTLLSNKGEVNTHYYHAPFAQKAVILIGGVHGDFDSPAQNVYERLSRTLPLQKISALRVQYREPVDLIECVLDVVAGVRFLQSFNIHEIAIVGHSFGGAVAIQAAANVDCVSTIVTLATQSFGADIIAQISNVAILFIHGINDEILSPTNSEYLHNLASGPKKLITYADADHSLDSVAVQTFEEVENWLVTHLKQGDTYCNEELSIF